MSMRKEERVKRANFYRFNNYHDAVEAWHREERCCGKREDNGSCERDLLAFSMAPLCIAKWLYSLAKKGGGK